MKTSSIAAAAVLAVVSVNQALAGGWIASARPNVAPLTRMIGVPINRAPVLVGPLNRFGPFNHFAFANGFGIRSGPFGEFSAQRPFGEFGFQRPFGEFSPQRPFGEFGFQRPFGEFGFQRPFGEFGLQRPFGEFGFQGRSGLAGVFPFGYAAPSLPAPSGDGDSLGPQIVWAPSYVTVVGAEPRCASGDARLAGGPKIIMIGASPRPTHGEKLPIVIYGTHGGCA